MQLMVTSLRVSTLFGGTTRQPGDGCGGCAGELSSKASKAVENSHIFGILLMMGYLGFDGFTSTWQDKMFKGYQMSVYSQMLYVQACSAAVSLTSLVAFGQVWPPGALDPIPGAVALLCSSKP